ncbi:MAG: PIG-L family deacetylase [Clostridia bacterium]|nr:PIG-L family deacetylase [Clostridia bacterium]
MKRWRISLAVCAGILLMGAGRAELMDWAQAQESAQTQEIWAEAQGDAVNTAVRAEDITKKCKIRVSEGDRGRLTDGKVSSCWRYGGAGAWIGARIPDDVAAGAIRIEWMFDPEGFELIEYDADQKELRRRTQADTFPNICTMFTLRPDAKIVQLKMTAGGQQVGRITLYSEGILPGDVQTWLPPVEKADLMAVSTHQDDEVLFLGGTIPYSDVVCGRPTVTVYMANCGRERRREALECLWEMGSRHYPEFVNLKDEKVESIKAGVKLWGGKDNILKEMVERIRRYKPEVIVAQDLNGEYGHNQHKIVARAMKYAVEAAADPARYPDSYDQYGAWQVKKLYIHLLKENQIRMDWTAPRAECGGLSLLQVAKNGMAKHASQTAYFSVKDSSKYDNALFGLQVSTVGEDTAKDDFFENIPEDASEAYLATAPTPTPRPSPTPESTPEPTKAADDAGMIEGDTDHTEDGEDAPSPAGAAVESAPTAPAQQSSERGGGLVGVLLIIAGLAVAGGGGWYIATHVLKKPAGKRRKVKKS